MLRELSLLLESVLREPAHVGVVHLVDEAVGREVGTLTFLWESYGLKGLPRNSRQRAVPVVQDGLNFTLLQFADVGALACLELLY